MEISLAYGKDGVTLNVPEGVDVKQYGLSGSDSADLYAADEETGLYYPWWDEIGLHPGQDPLIIVNDGHRSTPTLKLLDTMEAYDSDLLDHARFLIACGTHGEPSPEHLRAIFGPYLDRVKPRLSWHDCRDLDAMVVIGEDHFGEPLYLNRLAVDADFRLVITSIEPHYFAGFTGGRKSFFPGLTDRATIERNHNLANSLDCAPLKLEGNPMAEHLDEMLRLAGLESVHSMQMVTDSDHNVRDIFFGPLAETFLRGAKVSARLYAHRIRELYDLAVAEVRPPLDRSLYQCQKALENVQAAVVDGGTAVVVAACEDGIGKRSFYDLAEEWDRETNAPIDGVTRFGSHKLSRVNAISRRIGVRLYSELPPDQPRRVFYEPADDLQGLLDRCLDGDNRKRLAVVYDAGHTVLQPISSP